MTSAIGKRRRRGFTMVEILVVISIMLLLTAALGVAAARYIQGSNVSASETLLRKVQLALDEYKRIKGNYPPDGYDSDVFNDKNVKIRGSACLYYFFTQELISEVESSGVKRIKKHEPLWMTLNFSNGDRSPQEDPQHPGVHEIIDSFGVPIHYDNTEDGRWLPQDGSAHFPEELDHPPDPRSSVDYNSVQREGIQSPGAYDLWSHGLGKHLEKKDLSKTIASWNLGLVSK